MNTIQLQSIDGKIQERLKNSVGTPLTPEVRASAYNDAIQFIQSHMNVNSTKRVVTFDYLQDEPDYSLINTLGIADFKARKDIREIDHHDHVLDWIDEQEFAVREGEGSLHECYTFEDRDNDKFLRIIHNSGKQRDTMAPLDSTTEDGSWSVIGSSDSSNLTIDQNRFKEGSGSFNFDMASFSNGFGGIINTTLTPFDLTDFNTIGHWRCWADLRNLSAANLALVSGFTLRWGSSTSDYYEVTVTTSINNGSLKRDWNRLDFDWENATTTGTPDVAAVDYIELRINTLAGFTASTDIRFDDIVLIEPYPMEMVYFSEYMVNNGGTLQTEFSTDVVNGTEELLLPTRHRDSFIRLALQILQWQLAEQEPEEAAKIGTMLGIIKPIIQDFGTPILKEGNKMEPLGSSSGRVESSMW